MPNISDSRAGPGRDLVARLLYAFMAVNVVIRGFTGACSLTGLMVESPGVQGDSLAGLMIAVALLLLADLALNDILPRRFAWRWSERHRHSLYVVVAFCYLVPPFVYAPMMGSAWSEYVFYIAMAAFGLLLAFRDQFEKRLRGTECKT
ncbi:hypothetical protein [Burkholderia gladioli]|uniref:hypothetical protein n=1 Tax=Burkholderia gladioli TaxID=28095 RepID=UPI00163F4384|nr:hypothetical protein [Burkholderia gladioli]